MNDGKSDGGEAEASKERPLRAQRALLTTVCVVVVCGYAYAARLSYTVTWSLNPADEFYNLLVQGFRAGQLNLKKEVPPKLAQLADPYNPAALFPIPCST